MTPAKAPGAEGSNGAVVGVVRFRELDFQGGAAAVVVGKGTFDEPGAGAPVDIAGFGFGGGDGLELGTEELGARGLERRLEVFVDGFPADEVGWIEAVANGGEVIGPAVLADGSA
jgi:hypothetical protein